MSQEKSVSFEAQLKTFIARAKAIPSMEEDALVELQDIVDNIQRYPDALHPELRTVLENHRGLMFGLNTCDPAIRFSVFKYFSRAENQTNENKVLREKIAKTIIDGQKESFTSRQRLWFFLTLHRFHPESMTPLLKSVLLNEEDFALSLKEVEKALRNYDSFLSQTKSYFSPERKVLRKVLSVLRGNFPAREIQLILREGGNGEEIIREALMTDLDVVSNDGKRTYRINLAAAEAVVIIPGLGTPHPDKKFHVETLPAEADTRTHIISKAANINEYFHRDVAGDFVVSDYVAEKDWSKYDGRIAPKTLPFIDRLTSLCEKLRNTSERKPPLEKRSADSPEVYSYVWTRRELHQMTDEESRKNIHLLVPLILHYLGSPDPLFFFDAQKAMGLRDVYEVEGEFRRIIGQFLARMLGDNDKRPRIQEIVEFFECAKRYQENNSQEEMEVLKLMGNSRDFEDAYGLPKFPKARWKWFVELSDPKFYEQDRLKWRVLAKCIAGEKQKYTFEQRQFLRRKLQEYKEKQFDKDDVNGEYQKIIAAAGSLFDEEPRDFFPVGEEREALIKLMEEIKTTQKWGEIKDKIRGLGESYFNTAQLLSLVQMAEDYPAINFNNDFVRKMLMRLENPPEEILVVLSTPVDKRTPEQHEQFNASLGLFREASIYEEVQKAALTNEIALKIFCADDSSEEQRKYMAKYIAERIFEYSGKEVIQYFNKLKKYKLIQSLQLPGPLERVRPRQYDATQLEIKKARNKIVRALKAYRGSLFYFNPKRLDVSHVIHTLNDPSLQSENEELVELEYARILNNVLRLIPLDVLNAFRQSTQPFKKYKQYELVRTPNGKVFAIDYAKDLGGGAYGVVYAAYEVNESTGKLGKRVAVKFFSGDSTQQDVLNEAKAAQKSFQVEGIATDKRNTCLVMEYVEGKPIAKNSWSDGTFANTADISTLPLAERFKAIVMLIAEVSAAHEHRTRGNAFLHRDIRLENVHIEINNRKVNDVRLLDFGLAAFIPAFCDPKGAMFNTDNHMGTRGFVAPEALKTLKSDMRSLLPVVLPFLGVYRLYYSQDVDARGTVRNYLLSGLLKGMEKELPLQLRAALFQFILKMESYEEPNARPSDDEAFHFFNALYNFCRAENKAAWHQVEEHEKLQQAYSEITPQNAYRWFQHLREIENPDEETKAEIQRVAEMACDVINTVEQRSVLLKYFIDNEASYDQNKARWQDLLKQLVEGWVNLDKPSLVQLLKVLNARRAEMPAIVFKAGDAETPLDDFIFATFKSLSKTKNYERDQASWYFLATIISENLDKYSGADLLTILRKINKFNGDGAYNNYRDAVKAKLNEQWGNACTDVMRELNISPTGPSWSRSAMDDLKAAIEGQCFWSRNNRRYLKNAVSESPNEAVDAVVKRLGKGAVGVGA